MLYRYRHRKRSQNDCDGGLLFNDADLNAIVRSGKESNGIFRQLMVQNGIEDYRWVFEFDDDLWSSCDDREYIVKSVNPLILVDTTDNKEIELKKHSRAYLWDVQKLACESVFEVDPKYWLENIAIHGILKPEEEGTDLQNVLWSNAYLKRFDILQSQRWTRHTHLGCLLYWHPTKQGTQ